MSGRYIVDAKYAEKSGPKAAQHIPARSSKTSEKLVLLPDMPDAPDEATAAAEDDDDAAPPSDADLARRQYPVDGDRSYAERLPKARRAEKLARVTAYCTAQSSRLRATAEFIREQHGARTKLYDDCLYCVYQLPLLGGSDGYRIRSSPVRKNPGGKSVLDEQIEANERRDHREGWRDEQYEYSVRGNEGHQSEEQDAQDEQTELDQTNGEHEERRPSNASSTDLTSPIVPIAAMTTAELYIFSYGVAVFWNFGEFQEKDILADLTFSSTVLQSPKSPLLLDSNARLSAIANSALFTRPLPEADFETEEFHFEYNRSVDKPRIYHDMITLRTTDHMIKLAMSHAIAQSTKLCFFEERMHRTMSKAQYVPRRLALEGTLGMSRSEVVALVGKLFEGRVDVNLCKSALFHLRI